MKVIKPTAITQAMLTASTAAEPGAGEAVWSAGTTYAVDVKVILASTNRVYQSLQAGNLARAPDTSPLWWVDTGPTNRWAMFDQQVSTLTTLASPLSVSIAPGAINSLALLGAVGATATVTMLDAPGGALVYSATASLDSSIVTDWWQYYFEPIVLTGELVFTNLPSYRNGVISVTITGTGTVSCAGLVVGAVYDLGPTNMGAKIGMVDFSRKDTDAFGVTTFVKRAFSKRVTAEFYVTTPALSKIQQLLAGLRATPCVWIGSEQSAYASLIVFGFYRDFSITVAYPNYNLCNLDIEGLT